MEELTPNKDAVIASGEKGKEPISQAPNNIVNNPKSIQETPTEVQDSKDEKAIEPIAEKKKSIEKEEVKVTDKEKVISKKEEASEKKVEADSETAKNPKPRIQPNEVTKEEKEKNLQLKLQVIEDLKALVEKEESGNDTFAEFRAIQERWRNIGMIPVGNVNNLWETYHHYVENFYNFIKINKELRDLDWKKNYEEKEELCIEAERLAQSDDTTTAFKQLQLLHASWKEIGPVAREYKESIWDRFKAATTIINDKYHNFLDTLKQEQEDNLLAKEELCAKAEKIAKQEFAKISEWNTASKNLIELQEEWRYSGTVPPRERNKIYKKFRGICDDFFNRKREFLKILNVEQEKNLDLKVELCKKVEAIKDSSEWRTTTDKIISYQKEWKKIGPAPKKYSNKVWGRFRAACDEFFNRKSEFFKDIDAEQDKNLKLKQDLIEEINNFEFSEDRNNDINRLKDFQKRWSEIGFVPIKQKNSIQDSFRQAMNKNFDKLNVDEHERNLERFKARINTFSSGNNKEYKIINEREKLVSKIKQIENDVNTLENNIGFFTKSAKSDTIIREMEEKVEKAKERLSLLQEKLREIDKMI